ncbi:hypothetical protein PAECIP111893_03559 [Paenibacillus plantiphilus]|uniref:Uncharacterized protein n=1 Tax=Paenibacillus plantiphilus TaxID=2905650 RepID=A0ABM9CFG8_9BACL|nr:hypothetical protein PAECIP111893_03559 [Paenibacillus plantiphilus]
MKASTKEIVLAFVFLLSSLLFMITFFDYESSSLELVHKGSGIIIWAYMIFFLWKINKKRIGSTLIVNTVQVVFVFFEIIYMYDFIRIMI